MPRHARLSMLVGCVLAAQGCASDRGQYAYAPPLAPPVYSQPPGYATPPIAAGAPGTVAALPGPVAAPGVAPVPAVANAPGVVMPAGAIDPCAQGGVMTADGMVIETPCEQPGVVMADGAVVVGSSMGECCEGEIVR